MSRHEIPALIPTRYKIVIGWDPPLQTYFGQVIDIKKARTDPDNKVIVWVGCSLRELYEIDGLAHRLRHWATLSLEIRSTLYGDKDNNQ